MRLSLRPSDENGAGQGLVRHGLNKSTEPYNSVEIARSISRLMD